MIICEKHKWIFIRNPKTGSRSLSKFLLEKFDSYEYGTYHSLSVPEKCSDYKIYIVIRNPFSRAVSAWMHVRQHRDISLEEYLMRGSFWPFGEEHNYFLQRNIFQDVKQTLEIIKYETLKKRVSEIFGYCELETIGKSVNDWTVFYDERLMNVALKILQPDFDTFGYKKNITRMFL